MGLLGPPERIQCSMLGKGLEGAWSHIVSTVRTREMNALSPFSFKPKSLPWEWYIWSVFPPYLNPSGKHTQTYQSRIS